MQNRSYYTLGLSSMTHIQLFVRHTMENPWAIGFMSWFLVFVPILGMWAVHNYGWEHWEPFGKSHKK